MIAFARYSASILLALVAQLCFLNQAFAGYVTTASGAVHFNFPNPGFSSCMFDDPKGGSCTSSGSNPELVGVGGASASADRNGLHIFASETLALNSPYDPSTSQEAFTGYVEASAHFSDTIRFINGSGTGYVRTTLTSHGKSSSTSGVYSQFIVANNSCNFRNSGGCPLVELVNFGDTLSIQASISTFVSATVGRGNDGSFTNSVNAFSNYGNTSFISELSFTDLNGNPINVAYSTDSGISYPQFDIAPVNVPEPATFAMLGLGLVLLASTRRKSEK